MADVATAIAGRRTVPSIYFDLDTSVGYMTTGQGEWQILRPVAECGIVHIWGHSWEVDNLGLWQKLERVFEIASSMGFEARTNSQLV